MGTAIFLPIAIPILFAIIILCLPKKTAFLAGPAALMASVINFALSVYLFGKESVQVLPWGAFGFDFSLRLYSFNSFILLAASFFALMVTLFSYVFMAKRDHARFFYVYLLISIFSANGAILANNLVLLLFFWEGLLLTLFGMIAIGRPGAVKTATKAFIIVGISDLLFMAGIGITGHLAGTLTLTGIRLSLGGLGTLAFIFLMIGAIAKAGAMPFHSWIPDAAEDAPMPFMAYMPAAFEKLLGIYFLTRISLDLFQLDPHSGVSTAMMVIGCVTILLAVMMALIQKNYKKLLAYHAISQVGYMILGIGTCLPVGVIGGLFHMINNALYKSCLFLTGGAVEKETQTTDLEALGGLRSQMPVTFICFLITALSISGVPPFNGFFSKELIYDAALERGMIFYLAAALGSFFTAASFLKLGHAAFFGKLSDKHKEVKEVPILMLLPMMLIAGLCVVFGLWHVVPVKYFMQSVLGPEMPETHTVGALKMNYGLVAVTILVLAGATINHIYGVKKGGSGLHAADHISHAPVLSTIYEKAKKRFFDPYDIVLKLIGFFTIMLCWVDRLVDSLYEKAAVGAAGVSSAFISRMHTGSHVHYIAWSLLGTLAVISFLIK